MRFPVLVAVVLLCWAGVAGANERIIRVATAADLKFALDEIIESFHRQHPDVKAEVRDGIGKSHSMPTRREPLDSR